MKTHANVSYGSNRNGGILIAMLLLIAVCGAGYYYREEIGNMIREFGEHRKQIPQDEIELAEKNMRLLFTRAQHSFIHHNQTRMAESITELGDGFTMGSTGCLIYFDIWWGRLERPVSDIPPKDKQSGEEMAALNRPYRYAILPVRDLAGEILDNRTTFVVAVPNKGMRPLLAMVAGPIRDDSVDFLRPYKIFQIHDNAMIDHFSELAKSGSPFTKTEQKLLENAD